ncbi:MAG TPA: UDP-N-acetylglucosamine 2-epimerase (non-hydrolyzing) [Flavobacteriales bacterium]|nr:UDP-N-acetylglucosamine 2-epimerase (non-hydrolyzing) [Flavobacteriales bacterium]
MKRLLSIVGARPQFVKAAAIDRALKQNSAGIHAILHTGQHYDDAMSRVFFDDLSIPKAETNLGIGAGTHGAQTARMIEGIEQALLSNRPDAVILYGDTNSTLAGAIAAAKMKVPIAHVEAGLRSFNKAMPEEVNRILCDHCSTWLFCPTDKAVSNLLAEGIGATASESPTQDRPLVALTGDVMLDSALHFAALAEERSSLLKELGLHENGYFLATIHRDFNTDDPNRLLTLLDALHACAEAHRMPMVLPLHPRTGQRLQLADAKPTPSGHLRIIEPVGYLEMIALERNARMVLTDSGGVQKEAYFFRKPCIVLRPETEWTELVERGQAILTDADPDRIQSAVSRFMAMGTPGCPPLYGDGHAADRIAQLLT